MSLSTSCRRRAVALPLVVVAIGATAVTAAATVVPCAMPSAGPPPQLKITGFAAATIHDTNYPIPPGALFVANGGDDHNPGSIGAPLATISRAIAVAPAGGTIVVRGGVYRESLGTLSRRVTIQAYPHEAPWVKGSNVVQGFTRDGGAWSLPWSSPFCATCYPSVLLDKAHPAAGLAEQVFVDGVPLAQVTRRSAVKAHTFYVDRHATRLVLADDPSSHVVEVTRLAGAFLISTTAKNTTIRGLGFEHWGTTYDGSPAFTVNAAGVTLDNDTFAWSAARALAVYSSNDAITNSLIVDNGMSGVNAHTATALRFEQNEVAYSNVEHWSITPSKYAELAGMKNTNVIGSVMRANNFHDNDSNGLWFDQKSANQVVVSNRIVHNRGHGLAIEVSGHSIVAGNVISSNGRDGLKLSGANDVDVYNDTIVDNGWAQIGVYEDPRKSSGLATSNSTNITLANDIIMATGRSVKYVVNSYDVDQPGTLTTLQMIASDDHNVWGRTNPSRPGATFFTQATPTVCQTYSDLNAFRAASHRELASMSADGWPLTAILVDPANGDYRVVGAAPLPAPTPLPAAVAAALGTSPNVAHVGA